MNKDTAFKSTLVCLTAASLFTVATVASAAGKLNVSNWADYMAEDTIENFAKEYDVEVTFTPRLLGHTGCPGCGVCVEPGARLTDEIIDRDVGVDGGAFLHVGHGGLQKGRVRGRWGVGWPGDRTRPGGTWIRLRLQYFSRASRSLWHPGRRAAPAPNVHAE